jgi:adenine-specific DNA methylase
LALVTFGRLVRAAHQEMLAQGYDPELAKAVTTYLALAVDKLAERNCVLSRWDNTHEKVQSAIDGHRLKMTWDYAESNPLSGATSSFKAAVEYMLNVAQREAAVGRASAVIRRSATELDGESMDAVVVDPPYYDNVPYADLSDFYYVWLRRTVGDLYPSDFQSPLTPKEEEITHNPARWGGGKKGEEISRAHYRRLLTLAFREMARVVKAGGPVVVMFTHRSLSAWEELLECLMDAGLYATASFPVHTEMDVALGVMGKGSVKSTIILCCRKRLRDEVGWIHELRQELREELRRRMEGFWQAGLRGANFFIAAMGPAIEVFGRHSRVLRPDGGQVTVREWLEEVHRLVADYAIERLDGLGAVDPPTRFYVLWRWAYGNGVLEFDDARKLAIGVGAEIDGLLRASLLAGGDRVVAPIALERYDVDQARRVAQALAEGRERDRPLVDFVHLALALWHRAEMETLGQLLGLAGLAESEGFWHSCQTILSVEEAFLAAARKGSRQTTLTGEDAESGEDEGEEGGNRVAGSGLAMLEREVTLLRQLLGAKTTIHRQLRML